MNIAVLGTDDAERAHLVQALQQALRTELASGRHQVLDIPAASATSSEPPLQRNSLILLIAATASEDTPLRNALQQDGLHYTVLYGDGAARIASALQSIRHALGLPQAEAGTSTTPWRWNCEKCSDPECEHRLFSALLTKDSVRP